MKRKITIIISLIYIVILFNTFYKILIKAKEEARKADYEANLFKSMTDDYTRFSINPKKVDSLMLDKYGEEKLEWYNNKSDSINKSIYE